MSCRRIRRELLWLVRFGDFDAGSAPHLEHLSNCQGCRDEVGLDRALVRQLRTALAERIGDASPSPSAWEGVLARMRQPEPLAAPRPWSARLAALLRAGSAMAGASLALVLALNLEMMPLGSVASPEGIVTADSASPRGEGARQWDGRGTPGRGLAQEALTLVYWMPMPSEQLPLPRHVLAAPPDEEIDAAPTTDPSENTGGPAVVLRLVPFDAAAMSASSAPRSVDPADDEPAPPAVPSAGGPS